LAAHGGEDTELRDQLEQTLRGAGASHIGTCYMQASSGAGQLRINNLNHPQADLWFV
jgi:hypothetical protein